MTTLQVGKRLYFYCDTCGEEYAENLDDYDPEDFVTVLNDHRVLLKCVQQHDSASQDDNLPDMDTAQDSIVLGSPLTSGNLDDELSTTEDDAHSSLTVQLLTDPSQADTSQVLVSSQDDDVLLKETVISLQQPSVVAPRSPSITSNDITCSASHSDLDGASLVSSQPACSVVAAVYSDTPLTTTGSVTVAASDNVVTPSDSHTTQANTSPLLSTVRHDNITTVAPLQHTPSQQLISSQQATQSQATPSQAVAVSAMPTSDARSSGDNLCGGDTPGTGAELKRTPFSQKDENKVTDYYHTCCVVLSHVMCPCSCYCTNGGELNYEKMATYVVQCMR